MQQLSLFADTRPAPVLEKVVADGPVVQGDPDMTYRLPHPKMAWSLATIQLHEHEDGRWMWAVQHASGGYKVGPKWGRFSATMSTAASFAAAELLNWCDQAEGRLESIMIDRSQLRQIRSWAEGFL